MPERDLPRIRQSRRSFTPDTALLETLPWIPLWYNLSFWARRQTSIVNRVPNTPEGGIWEMREVIQIGATLKVAVFHFFTRSYAIRTNVLCMY